MSSEANFFEKFGLEVGQGEVKIGETYPIYGMITKFFSDAPGKVEVEINYSTLAEEGVRADIDNVIKPTLDALKEVVYRDDRQVRSVTATIFDRNRGNMITGLVEYMGHLFDSPDEDVLLIAIYSDSRLHELGGKEAVKKKRFEEWEKEFSKAASKAAYGVEQ